MQTQIRPARYGDLPALADLWLEFMTFHAEIDGVYDLRDDAVQRWCEYIGPKFQDKGWCVLVAEADGVVIGYTAATVQDYPPVFRNTRHGFVQEIAVTKDFRKQGIGRQLVDAAHEWLCAQDVPEITVRIDERNPASKALFGSAGFEPWVVVRRKKIQGDSTQ